MCDNTDSLQKLHCLQREKTKSQKVQLVSLEFIKALNFSFSGS